MAPDSLSTTFAALADPTRRAILARLSQGEAGVTELAAPFAMSLPAVSKHLKVLERAGLVTRGRRAQWRPVRLDAGPLKDAVAWLEEYRRFWDGSFDRLDGYLIAGLPIVTAFPGWVYGDGSWCRKRVIEPVLAGRPVLQLGKTAPWVSPIHVQDCARALVHLAERGEVGGRYFLVNDDPVRLSDFAVTFARLANHPLRVWRVPTAVAPLLVGLIHHNHLQANAVFSNIRLRGIGFRFRHPTLEQGLQEVFGALHE